MSTVRINEVGLRELIARVEAQCSVCSGFEDTEADCLDPDCPLYSLKRGNTQPEKAWFKLPRDQWETAAYRREGK